MSRTSKLGKIAQLLRHLATAPQRSFGFLSQLPLAMDGFAFGSSYREDARAAPAGERPKNVLEAFFDARTEGHGIWKWQHYFEHYDRHFGRFVGRPVKFLEIGVYSGGSLDMWRSYFGPGCHIYGVDIAEVCRSYEREDTTILIGDQESREFWRDVRAKVPPLDIVLDDGGHTPAQQIVTFEEVFPHIAPGGVFVCEDIHGVHNGFNSYCQGLTKTLNHMAPPGPAVDNAIGRQPNAMQAWVKGIHFYPFMTVIEKAERPIERLVAAKRGTLWQPIATT